VSNIHFDGISRRLGGAKQERLLKAWARAGGIGFALLTFLSMAHSAQWKIDMMLSDPLVWMTLLVAVAAGSVCGYAVGVRVHARPARIS
jgi:hypothetical protein